MGRSLVKALRGIPVAYGDLHSGIWEEAGISTLVSVAGGGWSKSP